jgi:hypothetical protein
MQDMRKGCSVGISIITLVGFCALGCRGAPLSPAPVRMSLSNDICTIHKTHLKRGTAEVIYGFMLFDPSYLIDEPRLFPNAYTYILGGCVVGQQQSESVLYCEECRKALQQWCPQSAKNAGSVITNANKSLCHVSEQWRESPVIGKMYTYRAAIAAQVSARRVQFSRLGLPFLVGAHSGYDPLMQHVPSDHCRGSPTPAIWS